MILSLDQGTTSSRAIMFDLEAGMLSQGQYDIKQSFPVQAGLSMIRSKSGKASLLQPEMLSAEAGSRLRRFWPSASPISGKLRSFGTGLQVCRFIRPLSGRTGARRSSVRTLSGKVLPQRLPRRRDLSSMPISRQQSWPGFWTMCRAQGNVPSGENCLPELLTAG